MTNTTVTV